MSVARLGVNIDHIATLRQLRGTAYPDILEAAQIAEGAGAEQITVHLREDRRHIQDDDVKRLKAELRVPLNLEMAATDEMVRFACRLRPDWACLVPEKRKELTTEGGLDIQGNKKRVLSAVTRLQKAGIRVSLFIEPSPSIVRLSHELRADAVEFHTGRYCLATQQPGARAQTRTSVELERLKKAALLARDLGVHPHAGHGFDYQNIRPVAVQAPLIEEYNIGHAIICRAALVGLERAVREMVSAIRAP
ncbi:pyridoxine 5'-phosphate synthase [Bdellovibrionota bacterium FG-1]